LIVNLFDTNLDLTFPSTTLPALPYHVYFITGDLFRTAAHAGIVEVGAMYRTVPHDQTSMWHDYRFIRTRSSSMHSNSSEMAPAQNSHTPPTQVVVPVRTFDPVRADQYYKYRNTPILEYVVVRAG
jgi:hypothetical protein